MTLENKLRILKESRNDFIEKARAINAQFTSKNMTLQEASTTIYSMTNGMKVSEYLTSLDKDIKILENKVSRNNKATITVALILFMIGLLYSLMNPTLTGLLIGSETGYSLTINETYNQTTSYVLDFSSLTNSTNNITSVRLSGQYVGDVKVYLEYMIDNVSVRKLIYSGVKESSNLITGMVTGDEITEVNETPIVKTPVEEEIINETNETVNDSIIDDEIINDTIIIENVTENITQNITENIIVNITEEIIENMTANVTENITANVTANITENITANITEVVVEPEMDTAPVIDEIINITEIEPVINETNITLPVDYILFDNECVETCTIEIPSDVRLIIEVGEDSSLVLNELLFTQKLINRPPVQIMLIGDVYLENLTVINLSNYFYDPDNDVLLFDVSFIPGVNATVEGELLFLSFIDTPINASGFVYVTDGMEMILSDAFNILAYYNGDLIVEAMLTEKFKDLKIDKVMKLFDKYSVDISDKKELKNTLKINGLDNVSLISEITFTSKHKQPKIRTDIVTVNSINITNATVTLAKHGSVNSIVSCVDYNPKKDTCSSWIVENIPFVDYGDYIEFTVTHFSSYGGIINITRAEHLDENRTYIAEIFDLVKDLDDVWSEPIYHNEYVRVWFEKNLTNENDITFYARNNQSANTSINVYEKNSETILASFPIINETGYFKIYLENLSAEQDVFDLKIANVDDDNSAFIEFNHIIDPDYTMTSVSATASVSSVIVGKRINVTVRLTMDNKNGAFWIYVNTTNTTGGGPMIIDGDCTDNGDTWKVVDFIEDGSICLTDDADSSIANGALWCDGTNVADRDNIFELESCPAANDGDPYTFYSHCVGNSGSNICAGFGDATSAVNINGSATMLTFNSSPFTAVGNNITYNSTGDDEEGDKYILIVCTQPNVTNGYPGTCSGTKLCNSSETNNGSVATCYYTATSGDLGTLTGYGFLCDSGSYLCSTQKNASTSVQEKIFYSSPTESAGSSFTRTYIQINVTSGYQSLDNITIRLYNSSNVIINSTTTVTTPNFVNYTNLDYGVYYFNATAFGDGESGNAATRTVAITLPPTIISSRISPDYVLNNDTLLGYCNVSDADSSTLDYFYRWYQNGEYFVSQWNYTYDLPSRQYMRAITSSNDGNGFVIAGYVDTSSSNPNVSYYKIDSSGSIEWSTIGIRYGTSDYINSIINVSDGYVMVGRAYIDSIYRFFALKINSSGSHMWNTTWIYNSSFTTNELFDITQTSDGGYMTVGYVYKSSHYDIVVYKLNSTGGHVWNESYYANKSEYPKAIIETPNGDIMVLGYTYSYGPGAPSYSDMWVLRLNSTGGHIWNYSYGGNLYEQGYDIVPNGDDFLLVGDTTSFGVGGRDAMIFNINSSGSQLWNVTYGGINNDYVYNIIEAYDGGFIVSGYTENGGLGGLDIWMFKIDSSGNHLWNKTFGTEGNEYGGYVAKSSNGDYALVGRTNQTLLYGSSDQNIIVWNFNEYSFKTEDLTANLEVNTGNLSSNITVAEDNWTLECRAYDGTTYTEWLNSTPKYIDGGPVMVYEDPTNPNGYAMGDYYIEINVSASDMNLTNISINIYNSSHVLINTTVTFTSPNFLNYTVDSSQTYYYNATAYDIYNQKSTLETRSILVSAAPVMVSVRVDPNTDQYSLTNITGYCNATDSDTATISYEYKWYANDNNYINSMDIISGRNGTDIAYDVIETSDGGYLLTGYTNIGAGGSDVYIAKYTPSGTLIWEDTFGGSSTDVGYAVVEASDGYIIGAETNSFGAGRSDLWIIKVNFSGQQEWNITLGTGNYEYLRDLIKTNDGNYAIGYYQNESVAGTTYDFAIKKINTAGSPIWTQTYTRTNWQYPFTLRQFSNGNYALIGYDYNAGDKEDYLYILTDSSGNQISQNVYLGSVEDRGQSMAELSDGSYILVGYTQSVGAGGWSGWVFRLDSNYNHLSNQTYGWSGHDFLYDVLNLSNGNYIIAGSTQGEEGTGVNKMWLMLFNSTHDLIWSNTFESTDDSKTYSVKLLADGGFLSAGYAGYTPEDTIILRTYDLSSRTTGNYTSGTESNLANLTESMVAVRYNITLSCRAYDGVLYSDWMNSTLIYFDGAPIISLNTPTPSNNSVSTDSFIINVSVSDINLQNITIYLYNSSDVIINITTTTENSLFVNYTNFTSGNYSFYVLAYDTQGQNASTSLRYTKLNYRPQINSVRINPPNNATGSSILSGYCNASDIDNATILYQYVWYKNDQTTIYSWNVTIGDFVGTNQDYLTSIINVSDGYVTVGYSNSSGSYDVLIAKINLTGSLLWNKTIGWNDYDAAESIINSGDGGFIIVGYTNSTGAGAKDLLILKINSTGSHLWNKTYGGAGNDTATSVVLASDGGYTISGYTNSFSLVNYTMWLLKVDSSGNHLWNKTLGNNSPSYANALVRTADNGYLIGGYITQTDNNFQVYRTDSSGNQLWNATYNLAVSSEKIYDIDILSDGNYMLSGETWSTWYLIKINDSGNPIVNHSMYACTGGCYSFGGFIETDEGDYIILGDYDTQYDMLKKIQRDTGRIVYTMYVSKYTATYSQDILKMADGLVVLVQDATGNYDGIIYKLNIYSYESNWTVSGVELFSNNITGSETDPSDEWILSCRAYDGLAYSDWTNSTSTIIDGPPAISFVSPSETSGTTVSRNYIQFNISVTDSDLVNITIRLYNSSNILINSTTVNASPLFVNYTDLTFGTHYVNATAIDAEASSTSTETRNVSVNLPPTIISSRTSPTGTALSNETIIGYCNATDTDNSSISYVYSWLRNGYANARDWENLYGGLQADYGYDIVSSGDGEYFIAGTTASAGNNDMWVVKLNSTGGIIWNVTFGGSWGDEGKAIIRTSDGAYLIVGEYYTIVGDDNDEIYVVKMNATTGSSIWIHTSTVAYFQSANDVVQAPDGGYVIAATNGSSSSSACWYIYKITSTGSASWAKSYKSSTTGYGYVPYSIINVSDGYILAGIYIITDSNGWIMKIDTSGNHVWNVTLDGGSNDYIRRVLLGSDNYLYAAGYTTPSGSSYTDVWLMKLNITGGVIWNVTFGSSYNEQAYDMIETSDGNLLISGYTENYTGGSYYHPLFLKYTKDGVLINAYNFSTGRQGNYPYSIVEYNKKFVTAGSTVTSSYQLYSIQLFDTNFMSQNTAIEIEQNFYNLSTNLTSEGETWMLSCRAYDGIGYSSWMNSSSIVIQSDTPPSYPNRTKFSGITTNFTNYTAEQLANLTNVTLQIPAFGHIIWNNGVNVEGADFDTHVDIGRGFAWVNSSGLNSTLNSSANITLYNIPSSNVKILKDGIPCTTCTFISHSGQNYSFQVASFSNYSLTMNVTLTSPADNSVANSPVTFISKIGDITGIVNATLYTNESGTFAAKETRWNGEINYNDTGLILLYHLNNESIYDENATYGYDWSGQGHNLTIVNDTENREGLFGGGIEFLDENESADNRYAKTPIKPISNFSANTSFTLSTWVRSNTYLTSGPYQLYIIFDATYVAVNGFRLYYDYANGRWAFYVANGTIHYFSTKIVNVEIGEWHHLVGTYNTTHVQLFVDGVPSTATAIPEKLGQNVGNPNFVIGSSYTFNDEIWNGSIDEVAIWNRSLSAAEISALYNYTRTSFYPVFQTRELAVGTYIWNVLSYDNVSDYAWASSNFTFNATTYPNIYLLSPANNSIINTSLNFISRITDNQEVLNATLYTNDTGTWLSRETRWSGEIQWNTSGLIVLYHMNNESAFGENGNTLYDFSGVGNNAVCSSACPVYNESGKFGSTYHIDPSQSDFLFVDNDHFTNLTAMTVMAWVRPLRNQSEIGGTGDLVSKRGNGTITWNQFYIRVGTSNRLEFLMANETTTGGANGASNTILAGQWTHVVGRYNGTNLDTFINGIEDSIAAYPFSGKIHDTTGAFYLGYSAYNGSIDEVAFFNRSLSDAEIMAIYNYSRTSFYPVFQKRILANGTYIWNVLAVDNESNINWGVNNFTFIVNAPPPITISANISPILAYKTSTLLGYCNGTMGGTGSDYPIRYYYQWYVNTVANASGSVSTTSGTEVNIANISSSLLNKSQSWILSCKTEYLTLNSSWLNSTATNILNTVPTVTGRIAPTTAYFDSTLLGYCNSTDADTDNIIYRYKWFRNSVLNSSGNTSALAPAVERNVANVSSSLTLRFQTWTLECKADDGVANSTAVNNSRTILNYIPSVSGVTLTSTSGYNVYTDNLTVTFTQSDGDSDPVYNNTDWRRNGTSIAVLNLPFNTNVSSGNVKDYSTFNHLSPLGAGNASQIPTWTTNGKVGGGYYYDGNDYIELNHTALKTQNFAISVWFNTTYSSSIQYIYRWRTYGNGIYMDSSGRVWGLMFDNPTEYELNSTSTYNNGVWHHVVLSYNSSLLRLFVDGVEKSNLSISTTTYYSPSGYAALGRPGNDPTLWYFNGHLDEFQYFNRSLSPEQINVIYQAGLNNKSFDTLLSQETIVGDQWTVAVTPSDGYDDGTTQTSNGIYILSDPIHVSLTEPFNGNSSVLSPVFFVSNATDDQEVINATLYTNESGTFAAKETRWNGEVAWNSSGLVGLWHFNNETGENESFVIDWARKTHNATCDLASGECGNLNLSGLFGKSIDVENDVLEIPAHPDFNLGEHTISAWVYVNELPSVLGHDLTVIRKIDISGPIYDSYSISITSAATSWCDKFVYNVRNSTGTYAGTISDQNLTAGNLLDTWIHVVGRLNSSNITNLFINGVKQADEDNIITHPYVSDDQLLIGASTTSLGSVFNGSIDEVAIWNRSLSDAEILALYNYSLTKFYPVFQNRTLSDGTYIWNVMAYDNQSNSAWASSNFTFTIDAVPVVTLINPTNGNTSVTSPVFFVSNATDNQEVMNATLYTNESGTFAPRETRWNGEIGWNDTGLVALYHLNNESVFGENATLVYDWTENGNNATCSVSTCPDLTTGKYGKSYNFSGSGDRFSLENNPSLNMSGNMTISVWLNVTDDNSANVKRIITTSNSYSPNGYTLTYSPLNNTIIGGYGDSTASQNTYFTSQNITAGIWTNIVMTVSNGAVNLYMNGVNVTSASEWSDWISFDAGSGVLLGIRHNLGVGWSYNGSIDEVAIWNRSLSDAEILALYNYSLTKFYPVFQNRTLSNGTYVWNVLAVDNVSNSAWASSNYTFTIGASGLDCSNLTTANTVNNLSANVSIDGDTCFRVQAANITLDCNGFSITGNNTNDTYGVYSNQFNTTIKNCNIKQFAEAIRYSAATNGLIYNNTINTTFNGGYGIRITSNAHRNNLSRNTISNGNATGIYVDGGYNVTVDCSGSNIIGGNFTATYGIYTTQFNTTIRNCNIQNFSTAVSFSGTDSSLLSSTLVSYIGEALYVNGDRTYISDTTVAYYTPNMDLTISLGSDSNVLQNVTALGSRRGLRLNGDNNIISGGSYTGDFTGIEISSANNNTISNIIANATSSAVSYIRAGISINPSGGAAENNSIINATIYAISHGIYINGGPNNYIDCQGNTILGINRSDVYGIYSNQTNTTVKNCIFRDWNNSIRLINATNGSYLNNTFIPMSGSMHVYLDANASGNKFILNNFSATTGLYINDTNGSNYYNGTFDGKNQGNIYPNVLNGTVVITGNESSSVPGLYIGTGGSSYPYTNTTSLGKFSCNFAGCADYAPLTNQYDAIPVVNSSIILPSPAYVNESLRGYCNATDADDATIYYHYSWFLNGAANASGTVGPYSQAVQINVANVSNSSLAVGQNWTLECKADDGTINSTALNSSVTTIQARIPEKVVLKNPTNGNTTIHERQPLFEWYASNHTIYYEVNITSNNCPSKYGNVSITNFTPDSELCLKSEGYNTYYNWTVRACSPDACGNWSAVWNFTIEPYVDLTLVVDSINFSSLTINQERETSSGTPSPFIIRNDGNVIADLVNISVNQSMWQSVSLNTEYFQAKANISEINSFNTTGSLMNYFNLTSTNVSIIKQLNYSDANDQAAVDIRIKVPPAEPPGIKNAQIIFSWVQTP